MFTRPKTSILGGQPSPKCVDLAVSQVHVTWVWHVRKTQDVWTWWITKSKVHDLTVNQVHVMWVQHVCQTQGTWTWWTTKSKVCGLGSQTSLHNVSLTCLPDPRRLDLVNNQVQSTWTWQSAKSKWCGPNLFSYNLINF